MPKKTSSQLQAENKVLRQLIKDTAEKEKPKEPTITLKAAAVEAHKHVLAGRNIGVIGIGGIILSLMVMLIHNVAGTVAAMGAVAIISWFTVMRVKEAQYLEQKYGIKPKPIINVQQPPQNQPGFKGI